MCVTSSDPRNMLQCSAIPMTNAVIFRVYGLAFIGVIVGTVEVLSVMVGYTMFMRVWSSTQAMVHFIGLILLCVFIDARWSTSSLAAIVSFCSVAPCLMEGVLSLIATRFRFKRW